MTKSRLDKPDVDKEWEVRNAADTLMQAEAVKRDGKLMKLVKVELTRRSKELKAAQARL